MSAVLSLAAPHTLSPRRLRGALRISRERMGRLLDVTGKTVERLEAADRPPASAAAAARLAQIQEIVDLGLVVFTADGFPRFIATPAPVFGGLTALQVIERGEAERVLAALAALYEGAPT